MRLHNSELANQFNELADLLELQEENPFRVQAYRNAARTISNLPREIESLLQEGADLTQLPNIGKDLDAKIRSIVEREEFPLLEQMRNKVPAVFRDMLQIPNLGPKRIKRIRGELHIQNIVDLQRAVTLGKLRELPGFGEKIENKIKASLDKFIGKTKRFFLAEAWPVAERCVTYLKNLPGVKEVVVAGSCRRQQETVGDLDIVVTATKGHKVVNSFIQYAEVDEVVSQGSTRVSVRLRAGIQVDIRVVNHRSLGSALHYFTGSKSHVVAIRQKAVKQGLKINEYGVYKHNTRIAGKTEKEVYASVGLAYIEPELRENRGEIEAALHHQLPTLITLQDIRGDLHCHTTASDGMNTLEAMVLAAKDQGYEYIAITDHSQHLTVAKGLDEKRLRLQIEEIDRLNAKINGITVLKSSECDILEDGTLDLPAHILKELDLCVCSVHYKFDLSEKKQTERIIRAMDNPYFTILAHPTGRLINKREPYAINMEKIILAAKERHCFLEINANPWRLDLNDIHCKLAKEIGAKVVISTDSHSVANLQGMKFGVTQARRGWIEASDTLNTSSLRKLRKLLRR